MTKVYRRTTLRHWSSLLAIVLLAHLAIGTARAAALPPTVADALKEAGIPQENVSVLVRSADAGPALIRLNAAEPRNPASVMKLVTTFAALELLGPAHTWKTEALVDTRPINGRLEGNVYLRGGGDPRLALEQFWLFLRQLRMRGVTEIAGDLVLDRSAFSLPPHDPAEFDNEPLRPYNAGPDALLVNLKSLRLVLHPEIAEARVAVLPDTPGAERVVVNRIMLGNGSCGDWREKLRFELNGQSITVRGDYPASCGDKTLNLAPFPANSQVEGLFRALWEELGGTLRGAVREGLTPTGAQLLAVHESPTLGEVVREINKYSNNVMARQVLLALDESRPATTEGARRRIQAWLAVKGMDMKSLVLDNGSGLSRKERISADDLARLLLTAWRSPVMPELTASLPVAGVDGTLRKRLGDSPATGRAHLKTGYLENVRSLAGYVLDDAGRRWIVVFMINDPRSRQGKPAMDALLQWVAERGASADQKSIP